MTIRSLTTLQHSILTSLQRKPISYGAFTRRIPRDPRSPRSGADQRNPHELTKLRRALQRLQNAGYIANDNGVYHITNLGKEFLNAAEFTVTK